MNKSNHKKALKVINKLNLQSITCKKRKYSSSQGTIGKIIDNHTNSLMECFFGILKLEMFYGQERNYKNYRRIKISNKEIYIIIIIKE